MRPLPWSVMASAGPSGGQGARNLAGAAVCAGLLLLVIAGCGSDPSLARQEAKARAYTCASLEERHASTPVTIPPWQLFLPSAAERSDSQRTKKGRNDQNATEIKADCAAAKRGFPRFR